MSNGVWVSSACAATRKRKKPMNCVRMNGLPMKSTPKIAPFCWAQHDALQVHRAGLDDDADDREQQRELVGDELRGGAQRAEERELVRARPAGHEHADDREARDRQRVEHADVEVLHHEPRTGGDHEEDEERREHDDRGSEREDPAVGLRRHDVLLLEELHAVADELEPAVEATRVHRTEPALHVAHHLQQERVPEDERAEGNDREHDERLDRERRAPADLQRERHGAHRSMSPRMK